MGLIEFSCLSAVSNNTEEKFEDAMESEITLNEEFGCPLPNDESQMRQENNQSIG